jgi:hypothetical protein
MTCKYCNDYVDGWNEGQSDGHKDGYKFGYDAGFKKGCEQFRGYDRPVLATKIHLIAKHMRSKDCPAFYFLLGVIEDLCAPHLLDLDENEEFPL